MKKQYQRSKIEEKWLSRWEKKPLHRATDPLSRGKKTYILVEFPYPSGEGLHMGHAFTYPITDVLARKKRMEGNSLLYPMGWDAFGLPTENYALKTGIHPAVVTKQNTERFRQQMKRLALAYDWGREVNTTDPAYYRWTQWIFVQFFKHGLAYKQKMPINWCPSCQIGLANEEVVAGKCERCGALAGQKELDQWLLGITLYADRLAQELDLVDFPDYVKAAQRNWIGRKEWIDVSYPIEGTQETIAVSTTRPDTNFGATFVVLAPEHPVLSPKKGLVPRKYRSQIDAYIRQAKKKSELERIAEARQKTGVFTGLYAVNQLNNTKMPIWVTDFVLMTVGTGAVVGVPGHDLRDFEFAQQFGLAVVRVVVGKDGDRSPITRREQVQEGEGRMINSGFLNGMPVQKAIKAMMDHLENKGWGKRTIRYHLRDWIFSRQHYWGEPIPMVYCPVCAKKGITWWDTAEAKKPKFHSKFHSRSGIGRAPRELAGWFPLSEKELPLKLPKVEKYQPTGTGESPLAAVKDWVETSCSHCAGPAQRETDTMPNWAGSSWYFLRYCDPKNKRRLAAKKKLKDWLPVDIYLGGAEHTTLHLLYSRFWHKFLNDIGVVPGKEPYQARRQHGVILGEDGYRMSKSRGNVINPEEMVAKYGADALRLYLLFMGPYDQTMAWSTEGIEGCSRFLSRVWQLFQQKEKFGHQTTPLLKRQLHRTIKKVGGDIDLLKHNTAIAAMMAFLNVWSAGNNRLSRSDAGIFLRLLSPFAPFITEELWVEVLGNQFSIHQQPWPKYNPRLVKEEKVVVIVQVNGKLREKLLVSAGKARLESEIEKLAKQSLKVKKHLKGKKIKKVVFVPNRLLNFVSG